MFEEEILVQTPYEVIRIGVARLGTPKLTAEQRACAREAALAIRCGIEWGDPDVTFAAFQMHHALYEDGPFRPGRLDASLTTFRLLQQLADDIELELERGALVVLEGAQPLLGIPPEFELTTQRRAPEAEPPPPLPAPRPAPDQLMSFEARFVDEVGQAINGLEVQFDAGGHSHVMTTNAAGVALLEDVISTTASVSVVSNDALAQILDPRWGKARTGKTPTGVNTQRIAFTGSDIGGIALKPVIANTIVITPPLGNIHLELWDKTGRVAHANRPYRIIGPVTFQGTTDESGRLQHVDVPPGDYELTLKIEFNLGEGPIVDEYKSPIVVLDASAGEPQVRLLGVVPRVELARLDMFFNTNKTFLLPTALPAVRKLRKIYAENVPSKLLVVGHADTAGGAAYNDKLSLERAEATIAYLKDDRDTWLKFYASSVEKKKRWGKVEDRLMIFSMPDFGTKPQGEDAVKWYQRTRRLKVDGIAGTETRKALTKEYMSLDGTTLEETHGEIEVSAHGCGEHFPLDDAGQNLDPTPQDQKRDPIDRRVELFFFDSEFGILPAAPGKNSKAGSPHYPKWRERVDVLHELRADELEGPTVTFVELVDNLFRTNSAVVLAEGEAPSKDTGKLESLTSVGIFATVLRFNEKNPDRKLFVAGHCDTTSTVEFNQTLSEERARCALAVLTGDREGFKNLCHARHKVADYKQILAWVSRAFPNLVFNCDPGTIDDNASTGVEPVRRFQKAYNANKGALGATAPDLVPDGAVGKLTWGAIFDCYEFALQQELGEDAAGLAALRKKLVFADDKHKALGFSEHFPIEELGVDNFRSQANRRVEILFFEPNEEPDLAHAAEDPETSELYLPGFYRRTPLDPLTSARARSFDFRVHDAERKFLPGAICTIAISGERMTEIADEQGIATFKLPPFCPESVTVTWESGADTFEHRVFVECVDGPIAELAPLRLENLGYPGLTDIDLAVALFQQDYGLLPAEVITADGHLPQKVLDELVKIWDERICDAVLPVAEAP